MRVLQVIQKFDVGGAETIVSDLCAALTKAGHVAAIAAAPGDLAVPSGVQKYQLPMIARSPLRIPEAVRAVRGAIEAFRPTVIHVHNPGVGLVTRLAAALAHNAPILCTIHGLPPEDYRIAALILRASRTSVVSCGPGVTRMLRQVGVRNSTEIVNGVHPPMRSSKDGSMRESLLAGRGGPLFVSVGRLVPQKNMSLLVHAWAKTESGTLVVAGDGPERQGLESLAHALGVADRIRWLGRRNDVESILIAADAFVLSSHWEGLPLALMEAMSAGLPVVATDVIGVRELINDGVDGLLIEDDDAKSLSAALVELMHNTELATRLGLAALQRAEEFSVDRMVREYLELYERRSA